MGGVVFARGEDDLCSMRERAWDNKEGERVEWVVFARGERDQKGVGGAIFLLQCR